MHQALAGIDQEGLIRYVRLFLPCPKNGKSQRKCVTDEFSDLALEK